MKVILLKKCRQGKVGDVVNVANGFARNYLIPNEMAQRATEENLASFARLRAQLEEEENQLLAAAHAIRDTLGKVSVTLVREASRDMKLYGGISQRDIAEAIKESYGVEIHPSNIVIPHRLKEVGIVDDIKIKLHHDVIIPLELNILPQETK